MGFNSVFKGLIYYTCDFALNSNEPKSLVPMFVPPPSLPTRVYCNIVSTQKSQRCRKYFDSNTIENKQTSKQHIRLTANIINPRAGISITNVFNYISAPLHAQGP